MSYSGRTKVALLFVEVGAASGRVRARCLRLLRLAPHPLCQVPRCSERASGGETSKATMSCGRSGPAGATARYQGVGPRAARVCELRRCCVMRWKWRSDQLERRMQKKRGVLRRVSAAHSAERARHAPVAQHQPRVLRPERRAVGRGLHDLRASEAWSAGARARRAVPYGAKFSGVARCARSCTRRAGGAAVGGSAVAEVCGVAEAIAARRLAARLAARGRTGAAGGAAACMTLQQASG